MPHRIVQIERWKLAAAFLAIAAAFAYGLYEVTDLVHQNDRSITALRIVTARQRAAIKLLGRDTVALCALDADRRQNIADTRKQIADAQAYLKKHPNGAPSLGISAADIRLSIENKQASAKLQQQTIDSLSVVVCPKPKKKGAQP